ncbi:hypothetical protein EC180050_1395 [Escherichia coli 180050]|nr:hypothetical protein EC180050_1395 [Escherichia coli 180050]
MRQVVKKVDPGGRQSQPGPLEDTDQLFTFANRRRIKSWWR